LCEELLQDFRMMYPARSFTLKGNATAWCDPNLVRQILTVLLDNSVKFTQENGTVTIEVEPKVDCVAVSVTDNGVGMTAEVADHVFERFYKGDSSHNEKGYGLGLSIAQLMVESMGGTITVDTAPNKGSTFTFTLSK
jgi:two-component system OmpR family sensor kinase